MSPSDFSSSFLSDFTLQLIPFVTTVVARRPDEISPVPSPTFTTSRSPYAGGFFGAASQVLHTFLGLRSCVTNSAPSCSPFGANISTLQDSLYVTGCCFALPPQEDTPLQHNRSPGSTGSLLRGLLAVTTVGLSPTSRRQLSGHTKRLLGCHLHI